MMLRYLDGEWLNLAGPQRGDALTHGGQREAANPVKQTSKGKGHFAAAWTMVRVVLTAAWAV